MTVVMVRERVEPSSCEDLCVVSAWRLVAQMARVAAAGDLPFLSPDGKCETSGVNRNFRCLESRPKGISPAWEAMSKRVGLNPRGTYCPYLLIA